MANNSYSGYSNATRIISNYSASLAVFNGTDSPETGVEVYFYANYSSAVPRFGFGLDEYEIGNVVWNTSDFDTTDETRSNAFFDCQNDGLKNCIVVGTSMEAEELKAYYPNGTEITSGSWPGQERPDTRPGELPQ